MFTRDEVRRILNSLEDVSKIQVSLLYGSGLRLMECLRLRVLDIDFDYHQIAVRNGKGMKDRYTLLAQTAEELLKVHLGTVRKLHEEDLHKGLGEVSLPYALERKYPNANKDWKWQYVFPSSKNSVDPISGRIRRHHQDESVLQKAVKRSITMNGIVKHASCHTFRHLAHEII